MRHNRALERLFGQILERCRDTWLVKQGRVALGGSMVKANDPKHQRMSYLRMKGCSGPGRDDASMPGRRKSTNPCSD